MSDHSPEQPIVDSRNPQRLPGAPSAPVGRPRPEDEAPAHLGAEQRALWRSYLDGWELDHHARTLLVLALESHARMREAQAEIARDGIVIDGRANPATVVERDSRLAMLKCLRQIGFDVALPNARPGRPPGRLKSLGVV